MPTIIPSASKPTSLPSGTAILIDDDRAVHRVIELLLDHAGMPISEVARRMGIKFQSLYQYKSARRSRPSIQWLSRLATICGARIVVEFPKD